MQALSIADEHPFLSYPLAVTDSIPSHEHYIFALLGKSNEETINSCSRLLSYEGTVIRRKETQASVSYFLAATYLFRFKFIEWLFFISERHRAHKDGPGALPRLR